MNELTEYIKCLLKAVQPENCWEISQDVNMSYTVDPTQYSIVFSTSVENAAKTLFSFYEHNENLFVTMFTTDDGFIITLQLSD